MADVNGLDKIETLHAFIASDETGEGITAFLSAGGQWMPMVGADPARIDSLREQAQLIATKSGKRITLAKFSVREDVEVIEPVTQADCSQCNDPDSCCMLHGTHASSPPHRNCILR